MMGVGLGFQGVKGSVRFFPSPAGQLETDEVDEGIDVVAVYLAEHPLFYGDGFLRLPLPAIRGSLCLCVWLR